MHSVKQSVYWLVASSLPASSLAQATLLPQSTLLSHSQPFIIDTYAVSNMRKGCQLNTFSL